MDKALKYLTQRETNILFERIQADNSLHAARNLAIFKLAKYCALRAGEVGMLLEQDYYRINEECVLQCRREKNSNSMVLPIMDDDVLTAMANYFSIKEKRYPNNLYLFPSQKGKPISRQMLDYLMKKYCAETSIPPEKWHFHVLRHTRAVELGNMGMDLKDQQWWLGHKKIDNTTIYAQFTIYQQKMLCQKYRKLNQSWSESYSLI